jgi:hypothetical protein
VESEFHQLDFGLALPPGTQKSRPKSDQPDKSSIRAGGQRSTHEVRGDRKTSEPNATLRSNVSDAYDWQVMPGDLLALWAPGMTDNRSPQMSHMWSAPLAVGRMGMKD